MPKAKGDIARTLAESWTAPAASAAGEIGRPLVCIASTYTFHASFLESELLPRFLGLKFDETEGVRPFVVEREQALATARVGVLVDADHLDPSQTTLRWDQLPVRVPGGAQHSKIVLLVWENYARLIVSSANLTRSGYRRNREIAGVLDFFDHESSAPRKLIFDAMDFLKDLGPFIRVSEPAKIRWEGGLENALSLSRSWRQMPVDFNPRERPRVTFVGGLPRRNGGVTQSPLEKLIELWGTKRASEITVVTPFVGDLTGTVDPVVEKLMQLPRVREAIGYLVVPGRPSEAEANRMVVALPNRFREAWASVWRIAPDDVPTYVVPLCRAGEKANRDLHAKSVLVSGEGTTMLLCGSSNFSPHGMGVGIANVEANLCYLDDLDTKRNGLTLGNRLPVDWEEDRCENPILAGHRRGDRGRTGGLRPTAPCGLSMARLQPAHRRPDCSAGPLRPISCRMVVALAGRAIRRRTTTHGSRISAVATAQCAHRATTAGVPPWRQHRGFAAGMARRGRRVAERNPAGSH